MIEIQSWMTTFMQALDNTFADRIRFVGLQGSYARKEATETSDIDVVVILDELSAYDIHAYNTMLDTLPNRESICGFLSGQNEILNWEASDLFQFYYDTVPMKGTLDFLTAEIHDSAVEKAIKTGVCNIYHGCVHNMLYEKNDDILKGLYKSASFVLQAIAYQQCGRYLSNKEELRKVLSPDSRQILDTFRLIKNGGMIHFQEMSEALFLWAKTQINRI